jgi:hypothetical protein
MSFAPRPVDPRTLRGPTPEEVVDAALAELDGLADRPLAEHVAIFEQVHAALGSALSDGALSDGAVADGAARA